MREFMSALLDDSHVIGLKDIAFSLADDSQEVPSESPEVEEIEPHIMKKKQTRSANYKVEEDEALCYAWMNVSLDATVGADQSKETFWRRIDEYYSRNVKISSNRTQGSLTHRWSVIQGCCNRWSGYVDQMNNAPPSGVPITEYDIYIQELYKQKNKRNGNKSFTLLHCYAILKGNEKWARRNYETTPRRSRLSISSSIDLEDGEDDERGRSPTPSSRPDGRKQEKERKKNGGVGAYKEEFKEMIQTKRELALERNQEKMARWMELKEIEEEWLRVKASAEARLVEIEEKNERMEERRLAIEEERLRVKVEKEMNKKKEQEQKIMFMDASELDATARSYWELTRGQILASKMPRSMFYGASGGGNGGGIL